MIKKNFFTGAYVLFSENRSKRPNSFNSKIISKCPFCLENSFMIKEPVLKSCDDKIRIIENKYPFICTHDENFGIHEVLIDTLNHNQKLHQFSDIHIFNLIKIITKRINQLEQYNEIKYVQIFKNQGKNSGASLEHSHWQLVGLSFLPTKQQQIFNAFNIYKKNTNKCYLCSLNLNDLIFEQNNCFLAFCPEDSATCFEVNITSKKHIQHIKMFNANELNELALILKTTLIRLNTIYPNLDYNICFFNSSKKIQTNHHFFIQIIPRLGQMGGMELSSGCFINSCLPKNACKKLKDVII